MADIARIKRKADDVRKQEEEARKRLAALETDHRNLTSQLEAERREEERLREQSTKLTEHLAAQTEWLSRRPTPLLLSDDEATEDGPPKHEDEVAQLVVPAEFVLMGRPDDDLTVKYMTGPVPLCLPHRQNRPMSPVAAQEFGLLVAGETRMCQFNEFARLWSFFTMKGKEVMLAGTVNQVYQALGKYPGLFTKPPHMAGHLRHWIERATGLILVPEEGFF